MNFKPATLIKGIIWEALGVIILYVYLIITTGDYKAAGNLAVGYPVFRALTYYPYERIFKRVLRTYRSKNGR